MAVPRLLTHKRQQQLLVVARAIAGNERAQRLFAVCLENALGEKGERNEQTLPSFLQTHNNRITFTQTTINTNPAKHANLDIGHVDLAAADNNAAEQLVVCSEAMHRLVKALGVVGQRVLHHVHWKTQQTIGFSLLLISFKKTFLS